MTPRTSNSVELLKYSALSKWKPNVGDFVIYHGWFWGRWYGVINSFDKNTNNVTIIKEGLPILLVSMPNKDYKKNTIELNSNRIRSSRYGEYAVIQNGVLYVDG